MVLTMLSAYPGVSNADLARLSLLTPQTVSVIVGNLERAQLIARRPHAQHGRIQHIDLTDVGQQLLGRTRSRVHDVEQAMLAGLSPDEEVIVRRWLVQVALIERAG
jgi:DNA-binding MarR family transcriptional regulator